MSTNIQIYKIMSYNFRNKIIIIKTNDNNLINNKIINICILFQKLNPLSSMKFLYINF